ncbi:hypothetical protein H6P81_011943 [Aristolochia fimbriata]|uniref:U-box domain-containing protein 7 n=1 Tax=Aristolochia fimbriata TaxID=158543 RepID=A0AAV7EAD7_ARIFI|nr:hypothetical protein H6P81_011943 [Aristolochia fimbriata]
MSESAWFFSSYSSKLRFFARVRRFLRKKTTCGSHDRGGDRGTGAGEELVEMEGGGKDREASPSPVVEIQRSVKELHFGNEEEKEAAAEEIRRLAGEDLQTRKSLASLGVIPTLVSMLDSDSRSSAVRALIELSNGTQTNKLLMVEAGIMARMSQLIRNEEQYYHSGGTGTGDVVSLLLSLSSLPTALISFPASQITPLLLATLDSNSRFETKLACLDILYNLSTLLDHAGALVSGGVVQTLVRFASGKNTSEKALASLGNLVVSAAGKQAVEAHPSVPVVFIEILAWDEKAKCQEVSAYILMILAHGSSVQRGKMARSGIVPALLEVALLGSALAQKRALKILQWFKDERQMRIGAHSGPQSGGRINPALTCSPVNQREAEEGRRAIKMMVKQSLDKNMEAITRRANASPRDPSKLKGLIVSTSSKSLPY